MKNQEIAKKWREENEYTGGVVIVFNGEVPGWMNELRDPQGWEPGCIAVDEQGNEWVAVGGNADDGAERWERREVEKNGLEDSAKSSRPSRILPHPNGCTDNIN